VRTGSRTVAFIDPSGELPSGAEPPIRVLVRSYRGVIPYVRCVWSVAHVPVLTARPRTNVVQAPQASPRIHLWSAAQTRSTGKLDCFECRVGLLSSR